MSLRSLTDLGRRESGFIRGNLSYFLDLPDPDDNDWIVADQPPGVAARLHHLIRRGLIEKTGRRRPGPWSIYTFTTNPDAYDAIQAEADRRTLLPCGHAGFENHGDGEYSCSYEYCSEIHDRETIAGVLES